jgi:hypothetical protein
MRCRDAADGHAAETLVDALAMPMVFGKAYTPLGADMVQPIGSVPTWALP